MRKRLSIFILSFIIIIVLASCKNEYSINDEYKTILKNINENTFDNLGYSISYNQNYEIESHSEDEYEKMDYTINYEGGGELTLILEEKDETNSSNTILNHKKGYINSVQKQNYVYNYKDLDKISNEEKEEKVYTKYDNNFSLKFDNDNLLVASKTKFINEIEKEESYDNDFYAKINKDLLDEVMESDTIDRFVAKILLMDGQIINELIQSYSEQLFLKTKDYNDEELFDFINKYNIIFSEKDNEIIIDFIIDSATVFNSLYDLDLTNTNSVFGKMTIDKVNNKIISFEYDLKKYYYDLLNLVDDEDITTIKINEYYLVGRAFNKKVDEINMEGDFVEYTDPSLFIEDVEYKAMIDSINAYISDY